MSFQKSEIRMHHPRKSPSLSSTNTTITNQVRRQRKPSRILPPAIENRKSHIRIEPTARKSHKCPLIIWKSPTEPGSTKIFRRDVQWKVRSFLIHRSQNRIGTASGQSHPFRLVVQKPEPISSPNQTFRTYPIQALGSGIPDWNGKR
jgi:hypothetical protein